uniref:Vacuolar protein sorting-associated protein 51 homolog n=1 Tax=Lygus hesperus TaxID=30085 RepID=A0A0A9ZA99_LYGHE
MKDSVSEMDSKLCALRATVDTIDHLSYEVQDKLATHKAKIESTLQHTRMLKKVQFIIHLPVTIKQLMHDKQYHTCVKYWVMGDQFLLQHTQLPSIAKTQHECAILAHELYTLIEQEMCTLSLDDP